MRVDVSFRHAKTPLSFSQEAAGGHHQNKDSNEETKDLESRKGWMLCRGDEDPRERPQGHRAGSQTAKTGSQTAKTGAARGSEKLLQDEMNVFSIQKERYIVSGRF